VEPKRHAHGTHVSRVAWTSCREQEFEYVECVGHYLVTPLTTLAYCLPLFSYQTPL
jgi:hypothetical protein